MHLFQAPLEPLIALLFPDRCAGCSRVGNLFCDACRAMLTPYTEEHRLTQRDISAYTIGFVFEGPLRAAVHQLKYRRRRRVAVPLGKLMAAHLLAQSLSFDSLVAVPMHAERLAERGFNQAEELAQTVARVAGAPSLGGLVRVRATTQQAKLNAADRQTNMQGAFVWRGKQPPPARVLLIDDVLTTGATASACATALLHAGVQQVSVLALARSREAVKPSAA